MILILYKSKKLSLPNKFKYHIGILFLKTKIIKSTFHKEERLCSKKQIDFLFRTGKGALSHPIKLIYVETLVAQKFPIKAMFVVPKKNFRKAHDRNQLKRRMKEAYRQNKYLLYEAENLINRKFLIAYIFVGKSAIKYSEIESNILNLNKRIEKLNNKTN